MHNKSFFRKNIIKEDILLLLKQNIIFLSFLFLYLYNYINI